MLRGLTRGWAAWIALVACASCAQHVEHLGPGPKLPEEKARVRKAPPPPEWFWEPIETTVPAPELKRHELPIAETSVRRVEGAGRLWDELPPEVRERVRRDGVVVLGSEVGTTIGQPGVQKRGASFGAFYTHLREQRIPHVITLETLFALVHVGLVEALAHVEEVDLAPTLQTLLEQLETRLSAEQAGAGTELLEAYRIARAIISVARSLAAPAGYAPARDIAASVAAERTLVENAGGSAGSTTTSPLLGIKIDYSQLAAPASAARPGAFRALAWLGTAALVLVARGEQPNAPVGTSHARTNARAAMLLARLCDHDVDASIHDTYVRIRRLLSFVWGAPDDVSLTELDDIAAAATIDLTKPQNIANVVRVDKVRWRAISGRGPDLYDGSGAMGRSGVAVRIFGGHASADSLVLAALVGVPVGLAQEAATSSPTDRVKHGRRALPSTLDIPTWLGAPEARAILHESNDDAFDNYDAVLGPLQRSRQVLEEGGLHASVHGTLVDALITWANTTPALGIARTSAAERMRVESLLAAWTLTRHTGQPLARAKPSIIAPTGDLRVSGQPLPVLVEPAPAVIGRLIGAVRQIRRGLSSVGSLSATTIASVDLVEIEDILKTALLAAQHQASDDAPSAEEIGSLASLPARIARLEDNASEEAGPITSVVYSDPANRRVLATATGKLEPVLLLAHEASSEEPLLVVGAHLAHHEIVDGPHPSVTGAAIATRARAPWVASFRWSR